MARSLYSFIDAFLCDPTHLLTSVTWHWPLHSLTDLNSLSHRRGLSWQNLVGLPTFPLSGINFLQWLIHYFKPFVMWMKYVLWLTLSSLTLQQHPPLHRCGYAFSHPVAAVRGGNHWKSLEKKQDRLKEIDRQLLLLASPIRLVAPMPMIWFWDGTKSEIIDINSLPYQQIQTEALKLKTINPA